MFLNIARRDGIQYVVVAPLYSNLYFALQFIDSANALKLACPFPIAQVWDILL